MTAGELLAIYAIVSTSKAPGARVLATRVHAAYTAQAKTEEDKT